MKRIIENLQNRPLGTRILILWVIIAVIGISLAVWRVSVFKSKIERMDGLQESIGGLVPSEELEYLREGISVMQGIRDEIKEVGETIKDAKGMIDEASKMEALQGGEEAPEEDDDNSRGDIFN